MAAGLIFRVASCVTAALFTRAPVVDASRHIGAGADAWALRSFVPQQANGSRTTVIVRHLPQTVTTEELVAAVNSDLSFRGFPVVAIHELGPEQNYAAPRFFADLAYVNLNRLSGLVCGNVGLINFATEQTAEEFLRAGLGGICQGCECTTSWVPDDQQGLVAQLKLLSMVAATRPLMRNAFAKTWEIVHEHPFLELSYNDAATTIPHMPPWSFRTVVLRGVSSSYSLQSLQNFLQGTCEKATLARFVPDTRPSHPCESMIIITFETPEDAKAFKHSGRHLSQCGDCSRLGWLCTMKWASAQTQGEAAQLNVIWSWTDDPLVRGLSGAWAPLWGHKASRSHK